MRIYLFRNPGLLLASAVVALTLSSISRADQTIANNTNAIVTPVVGVATLYPSTITLSNVSGKITSVQVVLRNINHTFADDYDILLVGPHGQKAMLMSDCGGGFAFNNVTIQIVDNNLTLMPDETQFFGGSVAPTNHGSNPNDTFPPNSAQVYSTSLSVFNNTDPNGTWSLYVVDDNAGDNGSISGGWTLGVETTTFSNPNPIGIIGVGSANTYPSEISVFPGLGHIRKVRATLKLVSHPFPDDLDILLVGPQGQRTILMSDSGGGNNISDVSLTFDDLGTPLPDTNQITAGLYHPTNHADGGLNGSEDTFPPGRPQVYSASLDVFNKTVPDDTWSLYVVNDNAGRNGSINGGWFLDFDPELTILANISTRLRVEAGDNALIGGFIVTGTQPKKVIVRAIGPSLPLADKLANPTLELYQGNTLLESNDNWVDSANKQAIIDSGVAPTNDLESAIVRTLPANNSQYTAIVRGVSGGTGIAE